MSSVTSNPSLANKLFRANDQMSARIREFDWAGTPLGDISTWSQALRTTLQVLLANRFPQLLWWGPQYIQFYNDPYIPIPGDKHPNRAFGRPASECWSEIWHILKPLVDRPFFGGPATWNDDILLEINRHGFIEETHFTIAYSPVPDDTEESGIGGVLATVHEITEKVVSQRRIVALRDLGATINDTKTAEEACAKAAKILAHYKEDLPFLMLYLIDDGNRRATLSGVAGVEPGDDLCPLQLDLISGSNRWPIKETLSSRAIQVVSDLQTRFERVPPGPWSDPPSSAVVLPLNSNKPNEPAGFMIAGVSARLKLDQFYRDFYELTRTQISTTISSARAYEEEKKRAEFLEELDRAKTAFFSNVSHEFRTPLTLMLGPLEDEMRENPDRDNLQIVHRNSLRLLKLVNTLLDFSRIESGRIDASYEPTDLAVLTTELASVFRSAIEKAGLRLTVDCPSTHEPVYVDREMWEKIVLNLLSNAFKFTFEGEIRVGLRWETNRVTLEVSDTGVGIETDELHKVFDRFHRVRGVRARTHEGTGIGLALVHELARLHGGTVSVTSEVGKGSIFTVTILLGTSHLSPRNILGDRTLESTALGVGPFLEEALRSLPEADTSTADDFQERTDQLEDLYFSVKAPEPGNGKQAKVSRARILVVDDNADMRDYLRRLLSSNYQVETVGDGRAALDVIQTHQPDLVLTDVMMPMLNGFELLNKIRADLRSRTLPVIMLSARAGEEARVEGLTAGADDYLMKPFSARELLVRVQSQLALAQLRREGEQRVIDLLDSLNDAFMAIDSAGRFTYVNPRAKASWLEENHDSNVIGRHVFEVFPEARETTLGRALMQCLTDRVPLEFEEHYTNFNRWYSMRYLPSPDGGVAVFGQDITARKQAEARLHLLSEVSELIRTNLNANELSAAVARAVGQHLKVRRCLFNQTDLDHDLETVVNDYFDGVPSVAGIHRVSDYSSSTSAEMQYGKTVVNYDSATDARTSADYERVYEPNSERSYVAVPLMREGRWVASLWVSDNRPRVWSDDEVSLLETIAERTWTAMERLRIEVALSESEGKFRILSQTAPALIWFVDHDGNCRYVNQQFVEFSGKSVEQLEGTGWQLILHKDDVEKYVADFLEAGRRREAFHQVVRAKNESGLWRWVESFAQPLFADNGSFLGHVGVSIDITDRKWADEELKRLLVSEHKARDAAETANKLKDEFLATLSHELRNPLNVVLGYSELLLRLPEVSGSVQLRQISNILRKNAQAQAQLINDLLDLSRLQMGKISLNFETVWLATMIENAVDTIKTEAAAKGISVVLDLEDKKLFVSGDTLRLQQVTWNLLNNAVKFTPPGGNISVSLNQKGDVGVISVKDSGKGIEPDFLPHVFEMFRQADAGTNRQHSGMGIGLALVNQLVRLHGGTVEARSEGTGQGACFEVRLPLSWDHKAEIIVPETDKAEGLKGMRILIVDDSEDTLDMLAMFLESNDAAVTTARGGAEALKKAAAEEFDIVLSDISMPLMDGFEFLRQLRTIPGQQDVPVFALTGFGRSEDVERSEKEGFAAHLTKPLDLDVLIEKLEAYRK
ncbi:MAG TPA: ATP-binding protein [Pyrinomonadaceae bacterium]|nr:ATP-binding protein [Pyrinomonadaceae bacterium]